MSASTAISLEGLTKYYGEVPGIVDLTLEVERGEVFGFLGPNGAGKSTAILTMLGLLTPTRGDARLLGHDVTERAGLLEAKRDIGYIPGDVTFYDRITGERLLDYFGRLKGDERRDELLDRFPIPESRKIAEYSSGNRQKLAIVQAFMHDPELVIMDEPTRGLDPLLQNEFYELIDAEQAAGVTVFFSSHILSEVRRVCDRVAIIRDAELVTLEEIDSLLAKSGKVVTATFAESPDPSVFDIAGVPQATVDTDGRYTLIVTDNYNGLVERLAAFTIRDLEIRQTSLEDVFIHFYGPGEAFTPDEQPSTTPDPDEHPPDGDGDV
ncbi:ABC transporter ATP-binding protein [Halorarius halobius]|uniref:ABC transporter ATP-binding protein n=1 Tax=Halorarius halobius TaxID=2962671 RepID=UPI0020CE743C|nr:ABC transporter ATP-binding protein [Halorarius halobius]